MGKIIFYLKYYIRRFFYLILSDVNKINWHEKNIMPEQVSYSLALNQVYKRIKDIPGHIIELGAGKGRNSIIFGTLINNYGESEFRHYFGFDTFTGYINNDIKNKPHLKKIDLNYEENLYLNLKELLRKIHLDNNVTLIRGDLNTSLKNFVENGIEDRFLPKGLVVSLVYVDCNIFKITLNSLNILKDYLSENALIVIEINLQKRISN